jgi:hypothetical protein
LKGKHNKPQAVVLGLPEPGKGAAELKPLGGSVSDDFNNRIANQVCNALWLV